MGLLDTIILIMAIVNLVFSAIVYFHSNRKLVETLFAFFALNVSVWSLATFFMISGVVSFKTFQFGSFLHYISGNLVFWFLFWVAVYYPLRTLKSLIFPVAVSVINFLILLLILFSSFLFESFNTSDILSDKIALNDNGYLIFSVFVIFMFISAEILLIKKYVRAKGVDKTHLKYVILGTSIAGALGILSNLVLPGFGNFTFFILGPIVTTPLFVGTLVYAIVKYKLFSLKVVASEIFTMLLVIVTSANLLASTTRGEIIARGSILLLVIMFGYFLIKSVYQEVRSREKIEQLAQDLEAANKELRQLDQAKSEFISIASHQLRAPLTVINGYLSLIAEGTIKAAQKQGREALKKVAFSAEQLVKLVDSMLNLSRIESGKIKYDFTKSSFTELVKEAISEFKNLAKKKKINLVFQNKAGSLEFSFDPDKMREIVINLIDNAIKYSDNEGSVIIKQEIAGNKLLFSVKDNGIGIKQEDQTRLFTKFTRTQESQKMYPNGMGIGLYFVKRVAEDHKGKAWVESEGTGKGSTFFIELPMLQ